MRDLFRVDFSGFFKNLFFSIIGTALILCFVFLAYSLVFNFVTANPNKTKSILDKSTLYTQFSALLYDQSIREVDGGEESILKKPEVRRIALDVYDSGFAKSSTENIIDGLYGWLEGNKKQPPDLSIDLNEKNKEFAARLGKYAQKRAEKLPVCTASDVRTLEDVDILKAECLPPGISPAEIKREAEKLPSVKNMAILDEGGPEKKQDSSSSIGQSNLPQTFMAAKSMAVAFLIIAAVLSAIILYLSKDLVSGLKRLSRISLGAGILNAIMPIVFLAGGTALINSIEGEAQIKNIAQSLLKEFMAEASKVYYGVAVSLFIIAAGLYLYSMNRETKTDKIGKIKD